MDLVMEAASRYQAEQQKVFKDFQKNLPNDVRQEQRQRLEQLRTGHEYLVKALSLLKPSSETASSGARSGRIRSKSTASTCSSSVVSIRSARSEAGSVLSQQSQLKAVPATARRCSESLPVTAGLKRSQSDVSERLLPQSAYTVRCPSEISVRRESQLQSYEQRRSQAEFGDRRSVQSEGRDSSRPWSEFVAQWDEAAFERTPSQAEMSTRRSQASSGRRVQSDSFTSRQAPQLEKVGVESQDKASTSAHASPPAPAPILAAAPGAPAPTPAPAAAFAPAASPITSAVVPKVCYDRRRARPNHEVPAWGETPQNWEAPAGREAQVHLLDVQGGQKPAGQPSLAAAMPFSPALDDGSMKSARLSAAGEKQQQQQHLLRPQSAPPGQRRISWQEFKRSAAVGSASSVSSVSTVPPAGLLQGKAKKGMLEHHLISKRCRGQGRKHFNTEDHIESCMNQMVARQDVHGEHAHFNDNGYEKSLPRFIGHARRKFPLSDRCHLFGHQPLSFDHREEYEKFWTGEEGDARAGLNSMIIDKRKSIGSLFVQDEGHVQRDLDMEKPWRF